MEEHIELRRYGDIAGRPGSDDLFLVDQKQTRDIDYKDVELPSADGAGAYLPERPPYAIT